jgi:hypothetical protein
MRTKNTYYAIVVIVTGLLAAGVAFGQESNAPSGGRMGPPGGPGGQGMWGGMGQGEGEGVRAEMMLQHILTNSEMIAKIGLSAEQVKTLNTAIKEMKSAREKIKSQMETLAVEQVTKMAQTNVDETAVLKLVEQIGELRTQIAKSAVSELLLIKRTVTPDQMKKMREITREFRKEWKRPGFREQRWDKEQKGDDKEATTGDDKAK